MSADTAPPTNDLLGRPLSPAEHDLADLYLRLRAMSARADLAPCALLNCKQAMVLLWNACVDLDLLFEEPEVD